MRIEIEAELIQEGPVVVAYTKALDLSSCGKTVDEAVRALAEAIRLFLRTSQDIGTFPQVLINSGYVLDGEQWTIREVDDFSSTWERVIVGDATRRFVCAEI
jgi:hypothetical protein